MSVLRDPILLFVLLGGALAALHLATRPEETERPRSDLEILVTDADVAWLGLAFEKTWQRPPTTQELRHLVDGRVRDELLYREAKALGLEQGDDALRRRLGMKIAFLVKDAGAATEPTEAQLQAHLEKNAAKYARDPRRRFIQVYINKDKRKAGAEPYAKALLEKLTKNPDLDPDELGDRLLIESRQPLSTPAQVGRQFGEKFATALFALEPTDTWQGPLPSGYEGLHLVRILEAEPGSAPPLEAVRDRVRSDLVDANREAAMEAYVEGLRKKYHIRVQTQLLEDEVSK